MRDPSSALADAETWLRSVQGQDGLWEDYQLPPGASQAWTTACVGLALATPPRDPASAPALRQASAALHGHRRPQGWGYNNRTSVDADSTAWTLRLLAALGDLRGLDTQALMCPFLTANGGARTFADARFGRWADEHADVTPVVGLALVESGGDGGMVAAIRHRCLTAPWRSFWWNTDAYALARSLEFLRASGGIPVEASARARVWLSDHAPPASPFEAAQVLGAAILIGLPDLAWRSRLLSYQKADGGFPASHALLVPAQNQGEAGQDIAHADMRGLLTTAMATFALKQVQAITTLEGGGAKGTA